MTAGTYQKEHFFNSEEKLDLLEEVLLSVLKELGWEVHAWAVFRNHYHFIGASPDERLGLKTLTKRIHGRTSRELNKLDGVSGRKVWFRSWDTRLSFPASYLARLAYVNFNPVKHGLVRLPEEYPWCSAAWFAKSADQVLQRTISNIKVDRVNVPDDF